MSDNTYGLCSLWIWPEWQRMHTFCGSILLIVPRIIFSSSGVGFLLVNGSAAAACLLPGPWQASHVGPARSGVLASSLKPLAVPKPVE